MQKQDFIDLFESEEDLWWFVGMREISATLLDEHKAKEFKDILDVGCGTGLNLKWLERYTKVKKIRGLDLDSTALDFCRKRGDYFLTQGSATHLPFADESFDLVTHFDVLVQLFGERTDEKAITEIFRVLKTKGIGFIRVAAYAWMRSNHDKAVNSQRRYNLNEISQKLEKSGFTILRKTYANTLLFPVAFIKRIILQRVGLGGKGSDVKPFPPSFRWLNWVLTRTLLMESIFLKRRNRSLPFGLSAICLVQKN